MKNSVRVHRSGAAASLGCLAMVVSLLLLSAPAAQAAPSTVTASTMSASTTRVAPDGSVRFRARTTSSSSDDTGHVVVLEGRPSASAAWQPLSRTKTSGDPRKDSDGFSGFVVRPQSDFQFRLVHPAQSVRGQRYDASTSRAITIRYGAPRTFRTVDDGAGAGRRYDLIPGDAVQYVVDECNTCGYSWRVEQPPASAVVSKTGEQTKDDRSPGTVGGGQTRTYTFSARGKGTTSTTLAYVAPDGKVERRVKLTFQVV